MKIESEDNAPEYGRAQTGESGAQASGHQIDGSTDIAPGASPEPMGDATDMCEDHVSDAPPSATTDSEKKTKKRFTTAEQDAHRLEIVAAHERGEALIVTQRRLGLSKVQFKNYLADLYAEGHIQGQIENKGVCEARHVLTALKRHLPGLDGKTLINVQVDSSGAIVTLCK